MSGLINSGVPIISLEVVTDDIGAKNLHTVGKNSQLFSCSFFSSNKFSVSDHIY